MGATGGPSGEFLRGWLRVPGFIVGAVPTGVEGSGLGWREDIGDVFRRLLLRVARRETSRGRGGDIHFGLSRGSSGGRAGATSEEAMGRGQREREGKVGRKYLVDVGGVVFSYSGARHNKMSEGREWRDERMRQVCWGRCCGNKCFESEMSLALEFKMCWSLRYLGARVRDVSSRCFGERRMVGSRESRYMTIMA